MGWQLINTVIKGYADDIGHYYIDCDGYLKGIGNEEGYYCFKEGPWSGYEKKPFISDTFYPHLVLDKGSRDELYLQDFTFNNHRVFKSGSIYIFYSEEEKAYINIAGTTYGGFSGPGLREPYYFTDIDDTIQGDYFYRGTQNLPDLNGEAQTWTLEGAVDENNSSSTAEVTLEQDIWWWHDNGNQSQNDSGFCGKYYNEQDGSWKMVGVPMFGTNTQTAGAYVFREKFTRGQKIDHHFIYEGDKGHTIHYNRGKWVIGTEGTGKWSEGDEPSLHSGDEVNFKGYEIDEGTGEQVPDPKGDFKITFEHCVMGNQKGHVLMGEVSLWRRSMNN